MDLDIQPFEQYITSDPVTFKRNLEVYYYAINQLGLFLKRLKESNHSENTIVIATGDHNVREALSYPPHWRHKNVAVPIIFRVPEAYKQGSADTSVWVSHRDINNTICELALSNDNYFGTGVNLYDTIPINYFAVHHYYLAVSKQGVSDRLSESNFTFSSFDWNAYLQQSSDDEYLKKQLLALKAYRALVRVAQANSLK